MQLVLSFRQVFGVLLILILAGPLSAYEPKPLREIAGCILVQTDWADGDSFLVRQPDGEEFTLRLYGADCIEWHVTDGTDERRLRAQRSYFGISEAKPSPRESIQLAKDFCEKAGLETRKLLSKPFTVYTAFSDARGDGKYKRVYGFVVTSEGNDLSALLVQKGLARAFGVSRQTYDNRSGNEYRDFLLDLELQAAKLAKGAWSATNWDTLPQERQKQRESEREIELAFDNRSVAPDERLNLNTAPRDSLMRLPGIGEELANRIIEARPYQSAEELLDVSGIGKATLQKILPHIELSKQK